MGHVGRFSLGPESDQVPQRGQTVVIRTDRGLELGEVLARLADFTIDKPGEAWEREWRRRSRPDRDHRPRTRIGQGCCARPGRKTWTVPRRSETLRQEQFEVCRHILEEGGWPLDLLDVEPLLDLSTTVLHILGPHDLDLALLRARFRSLSNFDILFEPVGSEDSLDHEAAAGQPPASSGRCGDCNCSEGGCGSRTGSTSASGQATRMKEQVQEPGSSSCSTSSHSACSSCGVSQWLAGKRNGAD